MPPAAATHDVLTTVNARLEALPGQIQAALHRACQLSRPKPVDMSTVRWLSAAEVAELVGGGVSAATVLKWSRNGDFPRPMRIGSALRWRLLDLKAHFDGLQADRFEE